MDSSDEDVSQVSHEELDEAVDENDSEEDVPVENDENVNQAEENSDEDQEQENTDEASPKESDDENREEKNRKIGKKLKKPKKDKTGIVYLSRVPPFMKPQQIRHLLSQYGTVKRIFLTPEDTTQFKARKKMGGNKRRKFMDGWIEFEHKREAKHVAEALNTTTIGGKKSSFWHDDMWNLKYLSGFKWHHLTDKIAYENRVREQKMRAEIAQLKRENNLYLDRVESANIDRHIADRKRKKALKSAPEPSQENKKAKATKADAASE